MVEHLRVVCPPPKRCKLTVKRVDHSEELEEDEYGCCLKERDFFEILVDASLTEYEAMHILIHEWAHMLAWRPYHPIMGDHGADWGVWYARVWQKYLGME